MEGGTTDMQFRDGSVNGSGLDGSTPDWMAGEARKSSNPLERAGHVVGDFLMDSFFQFKVLFIKNLRLLYRNWKMTILVLAPPVFAVAILFLMQFFPTSLDNKHPDLMSVLPLNGCHGRDEGDKACFPLLYATSNGTDAYADDLMGWLAKDNGLKISTDPADYGTILKLPSFDAMLSWLRDENNFNHTYGAIHVYNNSRRVDFDVFFNATCGNILIPCPSMRFDVDRAFSRAILLQNLENHGWMPEFEYKYAEYPLLAPSNTSVRDYGTLFFYFASSFFFVVLVYEVVAEKERKLRLGMQTMGLKNSVYWLTWFVHSEVLLVASVLLLIGVGAAFQIPFFLYTNFVVNFLVFWSFGFCMNNVSFLLAALLPSTRLAIYVSLGLSMVGLLIVTIFSGPLGALFFPLSNSTSSPILEAASWILHLFPMFNFTKQMFDINNLSYDSDGIRGPGYSIADLFHSQDMKYGTNPPTIESVYWNLGLGVALAILTLYVDNIVPGNSGQSHRPWYIVSPYYWGLLKPKAAANKHLLNFERDEDEIGLPVDPDVLEEYRHSADPANVDDPVRIMGVRKVYKRFPLIETRKDVKACKNFSASIGAGSLLALLGHNGAGKSTTFNILTGLFPPSEGDGLVFGRSVVSEMATIRRFMGVCPQHDILWNELTAREHMEIFADMKRFYPWPWQRAQRRLALDEYLEAVKLTAVQHKTVGTYSGGMKRRLSVAIALVGDPRVVYLDEPTTGMDPLSRRHVWNLIQREKKRRTIVLTTHLMEEADILGDRIAVMSRGLIRAIGSSIRLKNKYGNGYRVNVTAHAHAVAEAKAVMARELRSSSLSNETNQFLIYGVQADDSASLIQFFRHLENGDYADSIVSASVSGPTLEEVFLNVTSQYEPHH